MMKVKVWTEAVVIPTYEVGLPEKNPVFIEKRVYQGSSGAVYPYPVIEKIADEKVDKTYQAVYLENDFVKIMILPELGGRVQMAFDKTKNRHFIYYNQVIKPALVGLTGPWISGGIEFNWPQHHRPSTFDAVDSCFEENEDGSATVWCSEVERMFRTKGTIGFTLYPDKNYLEIKGQLYNRTPFPQTFLWWANPAVKVNDDYQSVFPPDVNAVFDHGKRDVSSFPIAKGTYYKVDYSPGTDISRYKNIPVPTSYMAVSSKYNFVGGYENDSKGGLLHVANHHISPGKKQWTWGNGDFGQAWDRNLTDEDGPYIELMCGVYTDNQPDFSWIMPGEYKDFVQYYMPYRDLGVVKNATKNAMVNIEQADGKLIVKVYTTGLYPNTKIVLKNGEQELLNDNYDAAPTLSYYKEIDFEGNPEHLQISITDEKGIVLVDWKWEGENESEIPEPASPAKAPADIENNEQLYLTGLHLEQYRHAIYNPMDYYNEALNRDAGDIRCNNAVGLLKLRRAKFEDAEAYFKAAIKTLTARNPNPYDGEPYFNLGLSLKFQGKFDQAYDAFYKSIWNAAWQNQGYFYIAQLDVIKGDLGVALEHIVKSISKNTNDQKALHLHVAVLRKMGQNKQALALVETCLANDHFNFGIHFEKYLLSEKPQDLSEIHELIRANIHSYIGYALDYAAAGLYNEAILLLSAGIELQKEVYPLAYYYLAWFYSKTGNAELAKTSYQKAAKANPEYCFPNQVEAVLALNDAIAQNPDDAKALYYLGNFWYAFKYYQEAIDCWERSIAIDPHFPTAQRNLALAYYNKTDKQEQAVALLETAFSLDQNDARILMELDQLYKRVDKGLDYRFDFLEQHKNLVAQRDDVYLEYITLLNLKAEYQQAFDLLKNRIFHPWEGGEGKVAIQYVTALVELAKQAIADGNYETAIQYLNDAQEYPHNLAEGKLTGAQENDIFYWLGVAFEKLNDSNQANAYWEKAANGLSEPAAAIFYNDQQPDKIFYQGLALLKLNRKPEADVRFEKLINYAKAHINDQVTIDYFAVSLPDLTIWEDDLDKRNKIHCLYMQGLGYLGLKQMGLAAESFDEVLAIEKGHLGVVIHQQLLVRLSKFSEIVR
jgi:tetratricopeptide (TPR) repeat protein